MGTTRKTNRSVWLFWLFLIYSFIQTTGMVDAEEKYPTRPIKLIVPMTAGGPTDVLSRKLADLVGKSLGQEMIIENRPGAGGTIGASFVAKSNPDGYTVGSVASSTFTTHPFLLKMDFDPMTDFSPIVQVVSITAYFTVAMDSPMKTFNDLVEEGRKRQVLVGTTGMVMSDFMTQRLATLANLNLKLVPFGGAAKTAAAVLGGQVDISATGGHDQYVKAGKMRMIALLTEVPTGVYKGIPHVKEFGYDVDCPGFIGIVGPKGLPAHIHGKLEEEFSRAVHNPSMQELMISLGQVPTFRNSNDFGEYIREGSERGRKIIKELGLGIYSKEKR